MIFAQKSVILLIYQSILWAKVISNKFNFFLVLHLMSAHYLKKSKFRKACYLLSVQWIYFEYYLVYTVFQFSVSSECQRFEKFVLTHIQLSVLLYMSEWDVPSAIRDCRRRKSPDCVISNSSLLLLKPWAVLVCWRRVWLLMLNVSSAFGMCCSCSSAPMPLVWFDSYTYTRGQYYITGGKAFIYTF